MLNCGFQRTLLALALAGAGTAVAADGDLDATWAGGGRITFSGDPAPGNTNLTFARQIIRENTGNLLIGGTDQDGASVQTWFLHETHADGSPVTTFGANNGSGSASGCSLWADLCAGDFQWMGLQADGRIAVLDNVSGKIARTTAAAQGIDTSVGSGTGLAPASGMLIDDAGGKLTITNALALTPAGDWILAGRGYLSSATSSNGDFVAVRLGADLGVDASFNTQIVNNIQFSGGQDIAFDLPSNITDTAYNAVVGPDGRIVLVGIAGTAMAATRLNADGSIDDLFGSSGGKVTFSWAFGTITTLGRPGGVKLDASGRVLIALASTPATPPGSSFQMGVARLTTGGSVDVNFGFPYLLPAACDVQAYASAVTEDSAGRVLAVGTCVSSNSPTVQYLVARFFGDNGGLDTTFGNGGFRLGAFDATSLKDAAFDVTLDAGGRPVIAGESSPAAATKPQAGMARLEYDLIFTNNYETLPRGRLPGQ